MTDNALSLLQEKLEYTFQDKELLAQALRHASATSQSQQSYERLEFLGDRILGLCVAELLYKTYPQDKEGDLAQRQSALVSSEQLVPLAKDLGLENLIQGETKDFSKKRPSVLADVVEALIAVIYLESGLEVVQNIIVQLWKPFVDQMIVAPKDPKSTLQEWAHKHKKPSPIYGLNQRSGPDHNPVFTVQVSIDKSLKATAQGPSLKQAEKQAALALLQDINHLT